MASNLAEDYMDAMKMWPYGQALYHATPTTDLAPNICGYIGPLGKWVPLIFLDDTENLAHNGLTFLENTVAQRPIKHEWGPKTSSSVACSNLGANAGASTLPAGFPAEVNLVLEFQSSSEFGAVLHCPKSVIEEAYYQNQRHLFKNWAKQNAQKLLELWPEVKKHGFWVVMSTYSTTDVWLNAWRGREKQIHMGFSVDVAGLGKIGPSGEFYKGESGGGWTRNTAEVNLGRRLLLSLGLYLGLTVHLRRTKDWSSSLAGSR